MFGRRKILAVLISVFATIALGVSAYLTWVIWQSDAVAGCTVESLLDCDDVLSSRWSKWFGVPVSLLGALTYLGILGLCWPAAFRPQGISMAGLFALALLAGGAAAWFVGLQAIQLQSYCFYCLTVHCCGLVVSVLALLLFLDRSGNSEYDNMRSLLGVVAVDSGAEMNEETSGVGGFRLIAALSLSTIGLVALMGGQFLSEPIEAMPLEKVEFEPLALEPSDVEVAIATDQPSEGEDWLEEKSEFSPLSAPDSDEVPLGVAPSDFDYETVASIFGSGPRQVKFQALPEALDVHSMPMIGSSEAPHVMLEMMDYTCKHCRKLHPHINAAVKRYGDQFSVMIYHVPLSKKCNPHVPVTRDYPGKKYSCDYAQLAIGVWNLAPEKFLEFHDWLLESEKPPTVTKARNRALSLVGQAILLDKKVKADITKRLGKQSTTLKRLNGRLPILLFTNGALRGVPEESEKLFEYLETTLGVEPR